jgi:hypothetical protein
LALYALAAAVMLWRSGNVATIVVLIGYAAGLGSVGIGSLIEATLNARTLRAGRKIWTPINTNEH